MNTSIENCKRIFTLFTLLMSGALNFQITQAAQAEATPQLTEKVPVSGPFFTPERLAALTPQQQAQWKEYLAQSAEQARLEKDALNAELKANRLTKPIAGIEGKDFKIDQKATAQWYASPEAQAIADSILSFQNPSGGWAKAVSFDKGPRQAGMQTGGWSGAGTFDNGSTTNQMLFLAKVYAATKNQKYADAFLKGLDYIFEAQMPNGGWPQVYPLIGSYHDEITFNDDMIAHVLNMLRDVVNGTPDYSFVDEARRAKAKNSISAAVQCLVQAQYIQNGKLSVWGAQIEPITLKPATARAFELSSLSGSESLGLLRFLMSVENPSPKVIRAVQGAVQWYRDSKITGIEVVRKDSPNTPRGFDKVVVANPNAAPLWARFYELGTNRPIYMGRDSIIKYNMADIEQERRTGYAWYLSKPSDLLENDYPKWEAKWVPKNGA